MQEMDIYNLEDDPAVWSKKTPYEDDGPRQTSSISLKQNKSSSVESYRRQISPEFSEL